MSSQNKSFNVVSLLLFKSKVLVASFKRITVFCSCLQVAQSDEPNNTSTTQFQLYRCGSRGV